MVSFTSSNIAGLAAVAFMTFAPVNGVVTYCTDQNLGGSCKQDIGCVKLDSTYFQQVSSIKVEPGYSCVFYTVDNCSPPSAFGRKVFPAGTHNDLYGYDNLFKSFYCYKPTSA